MINRLKQIVLETDKIFFDENLRSDFSEKGESDYVTRTDIAISDYLKKRLSAEFPDVGFLSEEDNADINDFEAYWILDPIDGTTNFMHCFNLSAVSLGYCKGGEITAGIIYNPDTKELFWAEKGKGAYLNGKRIFCSKNQKLSDSLGLMEYNSYFKQDCEAALVQAKNIYTSCQDIRTLGSAALSFAYIACGRADVFLGRYLKPWDFAAGIIIIEEAGGCISGLKHEIHVNKLNQHIIASNSFVYDEFLELLK